MSKRQKRPDQSYIDAANVLAKFVPSLRKYRRRKRLKPQQKSAIARFEKALRFARDLKPLTNKQAAKLKSDLYKPTVEIKRGPNKGKHRVVGGIQAIQLRNTSDHAAIHFVQKDMFLTSNGRTWIYWKIDRFKTSDMAKAGTVAFKQIRQAFPIEMISELAEHAFKKVSTKEVYLWAESGRVGEGFKSLQTFMEWVYESYGGYNEPEKWVRGIAIRL